MLALFGWIAHSVAYTVEVSAYFVHAVWVMLVRAALALLEVLDEWLPAILAEYGRRAAPR